MMIARSVSRSFRAVTGAGLLSVLVATQGGGVPAFAAATASPAAAVSPQPVLSHTERQRWHRSLRKLRPPVKRGCFKAVYPSTKLVEVPCAPHGSRVPYPPAAAPAPVIVGGGKDYSAQVTGLISMTAGSFDSVVGVTSETGYYHGQPPALPNVFSLQINTNHFKTPACNGSTNPSVCEGWQQFIFSNADSNMHMQYWLINYGNAPCPPLPIPIQWNRITDPHGYVDCYVDSAPAMVPKQPVTKLGQMTMSAATDAYNDVMLLTVGTQTFGLKFPSILTLSKGWTTSEFNVFGDCCNKAGTFNAGSTITVRTSVNSGVAVAPTCLFKGFTGETNNLTFVTTPPTQPVGTNPAIVFVESNVKTSAASCTPVGSS